MSRSPRSAPLDRQVASRAATLASLPPSPLDPATRLANHERYLTAKREREDREEAAMIALNARIPAALRGRLFVLAASMGITLSELTRRALAAVAEEQRVIATLSPKTLAEIKAKGLTTAQFIERRKAAAKRT